ncbi:MAG: APC family permease [Actinomycetota bacterium]
MKVQAAFKRLVVGTPKSSGELEHTLLPKVIALPVFASDPLSSNAYATQEIMLVLIAVGATAMSLVVPIALAVAALLAIVVTSYRQTVRAYPQGGGAYRVARENLGKYPGLFAASALLIDYVLTVAVSIVAGVAAIISAVESLAPHRVTLALLFVAFVTLMNLRGVREAGVFFAVPTYGFVLSIYILIVTGFFKCLGDCPTADSASNAVAAEHLVTLTPFLVFKAFAAGTTALTGVEAISDGVPAFRYPQSRNAATTLAIMGVLATSMFLGISILADLTNVIPSHDPSARTVVADIADAVFSDGPMFYVVQAMTAAILILAANTAYQDFPRLSYFLARDNFMPKQFVNRGDRLVFSNGVIVLAALASLLIVIFDADVTQLIQLYLVGVFISFTLSQFGMVARWRSTRTPGWKRSMLINGFGGTVTGSVFFIVVTTKFLGGAWIVIAAIPILIFAMNSISRHYEEVAGQLGRSERRPVDRRPGHQNVVLLVDKVDAAVARAVGYARSIRPATIQAVAFDPSVMGAWDRMAPGINLTVLDRGGSNTDRLKSYLKERRGDLDLDDFLTVIVPEILRSRSLLEILTRPRTHRLKAALLPMRGVQVLDIPIVQEDIASGVDWTYEPARNYAVVLVSGVHNAVLQAIEFAETLRPTDLRAVTFGLDPEEIERLGDQWIETGIPHPLEVEDAPYRDIGAALKRYLRQFDADGVDRVVTLVIPEFVVSKRRHQLLHGQTALVIKRHMLFEPGVVLVSVPYHIEKSDPVIAGARRE